YAYATLLQPMSRASRPGRGFCKPDQSTRDYGRVPANIRPRPGRAIFSPPPTLSTTPTLLASLTGWIPATIISKIQFIVDDPTPAPGSQGQTRRKHEASCGGC